MPRRRQSLKLFFFIALLIAVIYVGIQYRDFFTSGDLEKYLTSMGWHAAVLFIAIYVCATILLLPGSALTILGGFLFGPLWGALINLTAAVVGATGSFLVARYLGADWVMSRVGVRGERLMRAVREGGWRVVAVLRLVPLVPFNVLNYILGLTPIGVGTYMVSSAIFMIPGTLAYTYVGSLGKTALAGEVKATVTQAFVVIGLFVLVAAVPWFIRHYKKTAKYVERIE